MKFRILLFIVLLVSTLNVLKGQNPSDSLNKKSDIELFGNLYHQHHNFFDKAFSFQGMEIGLLYSHKLLLSLYGSCFVTNLKSNINYKSQFIWMGQSGINLGYICNERKKIHPGAQLNLGLFSLRTDDKNFGLFQTDKAAFKLNGVVISPQIFGELNICNSFKIRTGLSYNFYSYNDHLVVKTSDLNHISFTFGLVYIFKK